MSDNVPSPSDLHRVAAMDHETAAKLHREAAEQHDQHKHKEAKVKVVAVLDISSRAHNQSIDACHATNCLQTD